MVHALHEIERVLAPGALLIDLRPLLERWPAEVASSGGYEEAGRSTDLQEPLADDAAANSAMQAFAASGGFIREQQDTFPLFYYWDTPKEMREYIEEQWNDVIQIEEDEWNNIASMWARASADARVRLRVKMSITRFRKQDSSSE
jgi:hypothetical protein